MWVRDVSEVRLRHAVEKSGREECREKEKSCTRINTESHSRTGSLRWKHPSFLSAYWSPTLTPFSLTSHGACDKYCGRHYRAYCFVPLLHSGAQVITYFRKTSAASPALGLRANPVCVQSSQGMVVSFHLLCLISVPVMIKDVTHRGIHFIYPSWVFFWRKPTGSRTGTPWNLNSRQWF